MKLRRVLFSLLLFSLLALPLFAQMPRILTVVSQVTTNTTSAVAGTPLGSKTFFGQVVCSAGACTQTQAIYGAMSTTAANGVLLCTLTLSGTPRAQDTCPAINVSYPFVYVITTNTTGTGAAGDVVAVY